MSNHHEHDSHEENRLREALTAAVPEGPGADGRPEALAGRRRRQRQRRMSAAGGAAAVVAAVAVGSVLIQPSGPGRQAAEAPPSTRETSTSTTAPPTPRGARGPTSTALTGGKTVRQPDDGRTPEPAACPAAPSQWRWTMQQADRAGPVDIPRAATSVWVCRLNVAGQTSPLNLPTRVSTWQTDRLMRDLAAVPVADPDRCATVRPAPQPYLVNWTMEDGRVRGGVVMSSCDDVTVAGRRIAGPDFLRVLGATVGTPRSPFNDEGSGPYTGPTR